MNGFGGGLDAALLLQACSGVAAVLVAAPLLDRWVRPPRRFSQPTGAARGARTGRTLTVAVGSLVAPVHRCRRPRPADPDAVARWLDQLAADLRLGRGLIDALRTRRPHDLDPHLASLHRLVDHGASLADAIDRWRTALRDENHHLVTAATVLVAAIEVGGPMAPPLERTAALLRSHAAERDERASWASQAQLSARVLAALPPAVLTVLMVTDGDVRALAREPLGAAVIGAGLVLDLVGVAWMRRIIGRSAT